MNKKILYLFLALLLPGLIFLFLRFFGKNHFDIPVYYAEGVGDLGMECHQTSKEQYLVSDSVLQKLGWSRGITLLVDDTTDVKTISGIKEEMRGNCQLISLKNVNEPYSTKLKDCVLFLKTPWNAVLVDDQRRIRGYYKTGNLDEMDRLDVELKILLKNY